MALYGVLGDIHGNREALLAALTLFEQRGVKKLICVGDIVGYNAEPDECASLLRNRGALAVAGNHDLIAVGRLGFDHCTNAVIHALKRTRHTIEKETSRYLQSLPGHLVLEERILLVHGGVRNVEQYLATPHRIRENAAYMRADFPGARICLFGHVHEQKLYEIAGNEVYEVPPAASLPLRSDREYFINPGAVDAARKREHGLAECAVLDSDAGTLEFHSAAYSDHAAEARAVAQGYRIGAWTNQIYNLRRRLSRYARL